ncbi:MAG: hypothetical protein CMO01_11815 [Thalassobius sp.]|nr:hypothetical protein [Thalassovita sp.]
MKIFALAYQSCANKSWSNPIHTAIYQLCGKAIRYAFDKGILNDSDLWLEDQLFWEKLLNGSDSNSVLKKMIDQISKIDKVKQVTNQEEADLVLQHNFDGLIRKFLLTIPYLDFLKKILNIKKK